MTDGTTRREFLGSVAAFSFFPFEQEKPDLILHSGHIVTMNPAEPVAEAVAISRGRFFAVGKNADVMNLASPGVRKIDLGGKTVLPGFIDAHSHPAAAGLSHLRMVDCDLRSISAIQAAMRERAAKTPAGDWVLGFKYDDTKTEDGRALNISDLDSAVPDHPAHIEHRGGHTVYANSLAFRKAGIDEKTADPPGGKIDRDPATGKLSGRVAESGQDFFEKVTPHNFTRDDHREGVKLISKMLARTGITSATEAQGTPIDLRAYQDARDSGDLLFRAYCFINYRFIDSMIEAGVRTGLGDEWVRVGAMKLVCDGSISERTARLSVPYEGRPNDYGILVMTEEELYMHGRKAHLAGWQIRTQASDYPPGEFIPMMALQSEVTRTDTKGNIWGPKQKITVEEAIRVGTINGAYASYEENLKGSIETGKLADLVVLGRDPFKEDPTTLVTIPVERTMAGGRWTFEA